MSQQNSKMFEGGKQEQQENLGVGYKSKSVFGGVLALLAWALLIMEVT